MNAFVNRMAEPTHSALAAALGPAKALWDRLLTDLSDDPRARLPEWRCRSPTSGWILRTKRNNHTVLWLFPCSGCFSALFVADEKALQTARQSKLSSRALRAMDKAHRYPEGTVIRLNVKSLRDLETVKELASLHLSNSK